MASDPFITTVQSGITVACPSGGYGLKANDRLYLYGNLTLNNTLTTTAGTSGITIYSNATGTGSLIHGTDNIPATVNRYMPGQSWAWHLLSSPVASHAVSPAFTTTDPLKYDFYLWHEPTVTWVNYKNTTTPPTWTEANGSNNFLTGRGYLVRYEDASPSKAFAGNLNNGTVTVPLTYGSAGTYQHYNLVGNPYPSPIDWNAASGWTRTALVVSAGGYDMSIWNDEAGNYGSFNSAGTSGTNGTSRYIPVGQGFMVEAATAGDLVMTNNVRAHGSQEWLKDAEAVQDILRLRAGTGLSGYFDEVVVEFGHSTADGGAMKLFSFYETAPSLWTVKEQKSYAVDFRGTAGPDMVRLNFSAGVQGNYTLTATQVESFSPATVIMLEDTRDGKTQDLRQLPVYSFLASPEDDPARFLLHFGGTFGTGGPARQSPVVIYADGADICCLVRTAASGAGDLRVFDLSGRLVACRSTGESGFYRLSPRVSAGVYLVRLVRPEGVFTAKVLLH